jgi:hypothetical protein
MFEGLVFESCCRRVSESLRDESRELSPGVGSDEAARLADSFRFDACLKRERLLDILRSAATA